ncbi:CLUMA_CG015398, isoform A [Clunio marinus]|uniref:CLUMA_CG015398, isoform A n=1 Tax=Clunio marinus TaxID=568069 RepID=A0A1J1IUJ8_9DIPT|nr:CLUMA_CG015398, isoform A [Clunio marinus]
MSLRNIKKLQSPDFFQQTDDSEESEAAPRKAANNFELLSVSEREDDNETTEMENLSASANTKDIKKKRKNKKKRRSGPRQKVSSEDVDGENDDEITRTVKLVDRMFGTSSSQIVIPSTEPQSLFIPEKTLLSVQNKNLNPQTELKRMFGKVVNQEQQKKRRGGNFRSLKSVYLMSNPKDSWPPINRTGLYMNLLPNPDISPTSSGGGKTNKNLVYFSFEHSQSYRAIQQKFLKSVESIDSNNIVKIINMQPYHIDALIQLSELCKMSEDNSMAAELIEHALYAFECAFHSMFSVTNGNCRLDYRRQENRGFFIVLFKHAQFLAARACPRTALELSKLILSLDPENDPLAIILIIDFYALRSKQYDFLIQLYKEWETSHNLSLLPNMAYSYALALYNANRMDESDKAIQYALTMFPGVLKLLLDELSIQADSRVSSHKYFGPGCFTSSPLALQQLMQLYIARCKIVWSGDNEILLWLERNVHIVLDSVDKKDEVINDCAAKRSSRYPHPPRNILRHVILSEFKEKVPIADFLKKDTDPIVHFDPLPPTDSINIYEKPKAANVQQRALTANGLQLFFQSLLPSFNLHQQPNEGAAQAMAEAAQLDEAAGGVVEELGENPDGPVAYAEFRQSLNSIVDAMRDFLSDIRVLERNPNEDGEDENSSTGEEDVNDYLT